MNKVLARWNSLDPGSRRPRGASLLRFAGMGGCACLPPAHRGRSVPDRGIDTTSGSLCPRRPGRRHSTATRASARGMRRLTQPKNRCAGRRRNSAALSRKTRQRKLALEEANRRYEQKFGRIFIVCATGKTSAEMLAILEARMKNDAATELREAAEQQRQITQLRLHRWLESE